jgi:hypothetical protein
LYEWTAQRSAPVAIWNDERPRSTWIEQLYLAERLQPFPALIPASIADRALMFGYANAAIAITPRREALHLVHRLKRPGCLPFERRSPVTAWSRRPQLERHAEREQQRGGH